MAKKKKKEQKNQEEKQGVGGENFQRKKKDRMFCSQREILYKERFLRGEKRVY